MEVVNATPELIHQFSQKPIRQEDIDEWVIGSGGRTVGASLKAVSEALDECYVRALLNDDGECICLWGVTAAPGELPDGVGVVWLIASKEAELVGKSIHRLWPKEVGLMHMRHAILSATAYGLNKLHIEWLEAIGFRPVAVDYIGPGMAPFVTHVRSMECVPQ